VFVKAEFNRSASCCAYFSTIQRGRWRAPDELHARSSIEKEQYNAKSDNDFGNSPPGHKLVYGRG
jgi:hypothetical protein